MRSRVRARRSVERIHHALKARHAWPSTLRAHLRMGCTCMGGGPQGSDPLAHVGDQSTVAKTLDYARRVSLKSRMSFRGARPLTVPTAIPVRLLDNGNCSLERFENHEGEYESRASVADLPRFLGTFAEATCCSGFTRIHANRLARKTSRD